MIEFIENNISAVLTALSVYYVFGVFICVIVTVFDKSAAVKHKRRMSEKTLILLAVFFSAIAEYTTMKIIRHKTLHKKFMIGLPAIIIGKIIIAGIIAYTIIDG